MKFMLIYPSILRKLRTGSAACSVLAASACLAALVPASYAAKPSAATSPARIQTEQVRLAGGELYTFYAERSYRPLWFDSQGAATPGASLLLRLLETADYDGVAPGLDLSLAKAALERSSAGGSATDPTQAELLLSKAFVAYVQAMRTAPQAQMIYEHGNLRPQPVRAYHVLTEAAAASSLREYLEQMRWMHPLYAPLRLSTISGQPVDTGLRQVITSSLARLRGIPNSRRHVLVDVATARLWMYENGRVVDTMRVVVGKPVTPTPLLAGYIRYAITNPYWNVPAELVSKNIAPNVLRRGPAYLTAGGYQVLSDWSDTPTLVDPRTIDWRAVERGKLDLRVRQLPAPQNFMGKVKYEFPNSQRIYLHDTPQKDLLTRDVRQLSNGCIRLEDAQRLGRWLMRGELTASNRAPEQKVDLPQPIPIYITYLSAQVAQGRVALGPDPYGLDAARSAGAVPNARPASVIR